MHYELIALKILFSFNYLTLLFKMPRTSKNNYSFEWSALPSCLTQLNTNAFHGGVIKCKCIVHVQGQVSQVKQCFGKKIGEVWKTSIHHSHRGVIPSYWITFGVYLYPKCTWNFLYFYCPRLWQKDLLATISRIYGLYQESTKAARTILIIDRDSFGLTAASSRKYVGLIWISKLTSNQKIVLVINGLLFSCSCSHH